MKFAARIICACLGLALAAAQQGLPPGILLLARVKAHMRESLDRLPNCSCLETIHREHQTAGGKMRPLDTIRLEVLYSDHKEYYASPGDRRFDDSSPSSFIGSGTIGNGHFALFLGEVVAQGTSLSYEYKGEEPLRGRLVARYDYRVPLNQSGHTITLSEGTGTVGQQGIVLGRPVNLRNRANLHRGRGDSANAAGPRVCHVD